MSVTGYKCAYYERIVLDYELVIISYVTFYNVKLQYYENTFARIKICKHDLTATKD